MSQPHSQYDLLQSKKDAVLAVQKRKMAIRTASKHFGIPYTTLHNALQKKGVRAIKNALSDAEEQDVVDILRQCADWGMSFRFLGIKQLIQDYLNSRDITSLRFKQNKPSKRWVSRFSSRHGELKKAFADNYKRSRAPLTREAVQRYFDVLQATIGVEIDPANILTYYEINFTDGSQEHQVVGRRKKRPKLTDASQLRASVMFCASADGQLLPPCIVHHEKLRNNKRCNWFTKDNFEYFFREIIVPHCQTMRGPKILIGDDLDRLMSVYVITQCKEQNINFVFLPPNSAHKLQPLDVAFFGEIQRKWRSIVQAKKDEHGGVVPTAMFSQLLKETIDEVDMRDAEHLQSGFAETGIIPLNPDFVLSKFRQAIGSSVTDSSNVPADDDDDGDDDESVSSGTSTSDNIFAAGSSISAPTSAVLNKPTISSRANNLSDAGPSTFAAMDEDEI